MTEITTSFSNNIMTEVMIQFTSEMLVELKLLFLSVLQKDLFNEPKSTQKKSM